MASATIAELLESLETRSHAERVRAMIALGRQDDANSHAIIAELERGDFYQRMLALYSCSASGDAEHVLRALHDPSRLLRGLAARIAALVCDDTQAVWALEETSASARLALAWKLRKQRRLGVIDAYLERVALAGSDDLYALLPLGSGTLVERLVARFTERATRDDWRRLARLHPAITLTVLEGQIADASAWDGRLIARVNAALPLVAGVEPDRALALVHIMRRLVPLTQIRMESLVGRRPGAVADLVLTQPGHVYIPTALVEQARHLSAEQIIALYQRQSNIFGWTGKWFASLSPATRATVFAALRQRLMRGMVFDKTIVAHLSAPDREREARGILALPRIALSIRLSYAAYLPWDEMLAAVGPVLHSADAVSRQAALSAMIRAVAYHRGRLGEVLAQLRERRSEQDGTRRVMLESLAGLPPSLWRAEHLPDLEEIIRHGLNDVGLSSATLQQIVRLVLKLLPVHPAWAGEQLVTVLRERGWTWPSQSVVDLPPVTELDVAALLMPLLESWAARDDEEAVLGAVDHLMLRRAAFAPVTRLMEDLLRRTSSRGNAERLLTLLGDRAPQRFAQLAPALVLEDPSWITFSAISSHLLRHRQDLLTPFLAYQSYAGRWDTGRRRSLFTLTAPFLGGTAEQQERLAGAALAVITDESQGAHALTEAVRLLAFLPATSPARLTELADDSRSLVRTTALFALARLDTDAGLPALLAALRDERARIAIHALRPYLLAMPAQQAIAILRATPLERVTVAKEVIRLVGDLAPDIAYDELLAIERRELHRDVRIALLRSLDAFLDRPQTWTILEQAARSSDREVALAPLSLTALRAGGQLPYQEDAGIQQHALRLLATLVEHPDPTARTDALLYCRKLGIADEGRIVTPVLLERLRTAIPVARTRAEQDEVSAMASALFGVCASGDADVVAQVIRALLPRRRLLQQAVAALSSTPRLRERGLLPVVRASLTALAEDSLTGALRVDLAMPHLPPTELATFLRELAESSALTADVLSRAVTALGPQQRRLDIAQLATLEETLAASDDERLRRLALAVLLTRAARTGNWDDSLVSRLRMYRADPSSLVAAVAQFTFPMGDEPEEEGEPGTR